MSTPNTSIPNNTEDFVQDFWKNNAKKLVTLILDSGFHLKGLLIGFDGKNFRIRTTQYGGVEKTAIQPAAKVSTYIYRSRSHFHSETTSNLINAGFLRDFWETNKNTTVTFILDNGFHLKGLLTGFDGENFRIITTQYGDIESTAIQPAAKVSTYVDHY